MQKRNACWVQNISRDGIYDLCLSNSYSIIFGLFTILPSSKSTPPPSPVPLDVQRRDVDCRDSEKVEKIVKTLNLKILPRDLRAKDTRNLLTAIFSQWLPLSTSVLLTVINKLPSPIQAQSDRTALILENQPQKDLVPKDLEQAMMTCDTSPSAPSIAYVSKMVAIPEKELP